MSLTELTKDTSASKKSKIKKVGQKKRIAKKRTTSKKSKVNILKNAPKEKLFVLSNGGKIKNPKELADILEHLKDEIFFHHVSESKNDFATWIKDVYKDVTLAKKLSETKNKDHIRIVLYKHIINKLTK